MNEHSVIVWFRRDLRLTDNAAISAAADSGQSVIALYIHDDRSDNLWSTGGAGRWWLHYSLSSLDKELAQLGGGLWIVSGQASTVLPAFCEAVSATSVHWNRLYTPYAHESAAAALQALSKEGIENFEHSAALLFEPGEVVSKAGKPYQRFSPFWRRAAGQLKDRKPSRISGDVSFLAPDAALSSTVDELGLLPKADWAGGLRAAWAPGTRGAAERLQDFLEGGVMDYAEQRDVPAVDGSSRLSPHLHFGEISPVQVIQALRDSSADFADENVACFLCELGWREFAHHLLWEYPDGVDDCLQESFRSFPWRKNESYIELWQRGRTGYPIIDAGMRELWTTGWMHNRARMLTASFLVKDLMVPWQVGAAWFWDTLVDADLANNTLGWQWSAGCGVDSSPFFRIFNPVTQARRYDSEGVYVRRWLPELAGLSNAQIHAPWTVSKPVLEQAGIVLGKDYPRPVVDHDVARERAMAAYESWRGD